MTWTSSLRALEVGEELVPEARAVRRTLDEAGHVGDGELARVRPVDHAEDRLERREGIVGDLRLRVRDASKERRLAGVRQAGERRVDDELQAELELRLVAGQARLRETRRLTCRGCESGVPAPAAPAARDDDAVVGRHEIGEQATVAVEQLRPDGDAKPDVLAVCAVLLAPAAVAATTRLDGRMTPERGEVSERDVGLDDDVAATSRRPRRRGRPSGRTSRGGSSGPRRRHALPRPGDARSIVEHRSRIVP